MKKLAAFLFMALITTSLALALSSSAKQPEKITIIRYKNGNVKVISNHSDSGCYLLMGTKWQNTSISYVINPSNNQGLSAKFVTTAISSGAEEWDKHTKVDLFNNKFKIDYSAVPDYNMNGKNEYMFTSMGPGVIAIMEC